MDCSLLNFLNESFLSYAGGLVLQCSLLGYRAGVPNIDYDVSFLQMLKIVLFVFCFLVGEYEIFKQSHILSNEHCLIRCLYLVI